MNITLKSIPHDQQRYETVGDWQIGEDGSLTITVSDMGNEKYNLLVALHELIEAELCKERSISQESVDEFDKAFEAAREEGNEDEPGDDPKAPYRKEHFFATNIERLMAAELLVSWGDYEKAINAL